MKTSLLALFVLLCTADILNAQSFSLSNPFKLSVPNNTEVHYSKAGTESLPQRTLHAYWDDAAVDWYTMTDTTYTMYDNNEQVLRTTFVQYLSPTSTKKYGHFYTYNAANLLTGDYDLTWNVNKWDTTAKIINDYDSHGNRILHAASGKSNDVWKLRYSFKTTHTYDANDRLAQMIHQIWSDTSFINSTVVYYTYDVSGKAIEVLFMDWNNDSARYDTSARTTNIVWYKWVTKPDNGLMQSYERQVWNGATFEQNIRGSIAYDSHDNTIEIKNESWDSTSWITDFWSQYILTYNLNNVLTQKITRYWNGDSLENNNRELYDNFLLYNGMQQLTKQSTPLTLYPNPFEESATIEIPSYNYSENMTLMVYDLLGRSVLTQPIDAPQTILKKGNLQQGIYTFQLIENNSVTHTGKFIIK